VVAGCHRVDREELNTYIVFAMRYVRGELRSDGRENDAAAVLVFNTLRLDLIGLLAWCQQLPLEF
jgi:hypothetical protein